MKERKLHADTLSSLELWTRVHSQQLAKPYFPDAIIQLVDQLNRIQQNWRTSSQENKRLSDLNARLKRQIENYEKALDESKNVNRQLESELSAANSQINSLFAELRDHQRLFQAANDELKNINIQQSAQHNDKSAPPNGEAFEHQKIENNQQRIKRRSSSPQLSSGKRAKQVYHEELEEASETEENSDERSTSKAMRTRRAMNRSMSESHVYEPRTAQQQQQRVLLSAKHTTTSTLDVRISPMVGFGSGWTKGRPIEQCEHNYVPISNLFSAAFSYCSVCARGLGMRGLRCNGEFRVHPTCHPLTCTPECKLQIHENCRHQEPLPCVPMVPTPQRSTSRQRPTIGDLCPVLPPKIPGQIIRCVVALEKGFISTVGLYRVPGCDSEVKKLKEQFNSKYVPKLDQIDPETITGYIKKILRDLREPLIPFSSYKEFLKAVTEGDQAQLKTSIEELPGPNRDTLAFLCAHWQKVAMHSNENQMPLENLAKVLGPTVVGTSSKLATFQSNKQGIAANYAMEAGKQIQILRALLSLEHDYWAGFYDGQSMDTNGDEPQQQRLQQKQWPPGTPTTSRLVQPASSRR